MPLYLFVPRIHLVVCTYVALLFFAVVSTAQASDNNNALPVLTVYTYDSFVSEWGPGPSIEQAFEQTCACDLQFIATGDGAAVLARVLIEGTRSKADVVLGLDSNLIAKAKRSGLFVPHEQSLATLALPIAWSDPIFLPYDWGYFAFVYNAAHTPVVPANFVALANSDMRVIIQDPRSSTPGLGLLLWVKRAYGDKAGKIWHDLRDNIVTVTKGWSESYAMFLDGEADMVLSYTTSPAYHATIEQDTSKHAAAFAEGHYMQIEVAAQMKTSAQPNLARAFMKFILAKQFQSIIPTTNWMYPAVDLTPDLPPAFADLIVPQRTLFYDPVTADAVRESALQEWLTELTK